MKKTCSLLLILLLLALLPAAALAESAEPTSADFPYVLDTAALLSGSERSALEQKAAALAEERGVGVYIVTMPDFTQYGYDVYEVAKGVYSYYDLGYGEDRDGVLLLLSMKERDYALIGHGGKGETICGYESSWIIEDKFLDDFKDNDWYGGFSDYIEICGKQLKKLANGEDVAAGAHIIVGADGKEYHSFNYYADNVRGMPVALKLLIVIGAPLLIALIVCSVFKAQMKTAKEKTRADEYLLRNSLQLRVHEDVFTHRTETRTRIESDSGSRGGGGGSSFHSGGGFSGRSGKF